MNSLQNEIDAYEAVCRQIIDGRQDLQIVKKLVSKAIDGYLPLLELDAIRFFCRMKNPKTGCPAAILELLANPRTRNTFICCASKLGSPWLDFMRNPSGTALGVEIAGEYATRPVPPIKWLEDYRDSVGHWKTLLPKGRRAMILCNTGVSVRDRTGNTVFEEGSLNGKFAILDGCDYTQAYKTKAFLAYVEL